MPRRRPFTAVVRRYVRRGRHRTRGWTGALQRLALALFRCKGVLAVVALLVVLAGVTGQGRDLLNAMSRTDRIDFLWFPATVAYLSVLAYLSARHTLIHWRPGDRSPESEYARAVAPLVLALATGLALPMLARLLVVLPEGSTERFLLGILEGGIVTLVLAALGYFRSGSRLSSDQAQSEGLFAGFLLLCAGIAVAWYHWPQWITPLLFVVLLAAGWVRRPAPAQAAVASQADDGFLATVFVLGAIFLGLVVWLAKQPLDAAFFLSSLAVVCVFAGIALTLAIVIGVVAAYGRTSRWPRSHAVAVGAVVYGGLLLVLTGRYNEAPVAPPAGACTESVAGAGAATPTVAAHVTEWLDDRREDIERSAAPYPVYIVAAEGGGIRAAYWSAGILAALHDRAEGFNRHTLALSGVSGGSLGVGVYAALVSAAHERRVAGAAPLACAKDNALKPCVEQIVGADLLSASLAAMFLGDVWRSAASSPLLGPLASDTFPTRAPLLERSLERAFRDATGSDSLAAPFDAAWRERASRLETPLVISNMTNVATSDRAVLSALPAAGAWPGALDLGRIAGAAAMPASTALVLSARFPGIGTTANLCGTRLVDGGYADNSGLASVAEFLEVLLTSARARGLEARLEPVVLVVENGQRSSAAANPPTSLIGQGWRRLTAADAMLGVIGDPLSTFGGMLDASPARYGRLLAQRLAAFPHHRTERLALPWAKSGEFPLGWSLSPLAARSLDQRIDEVLGNRSSLVGAAPAPPFM